MTSNRETWSEHLKTVSLLVNSYSARALVDRIIWHVMIKNSFTSGLQVTGIIYLEHTDLFMVITIWTSRWIDLWSLPDLDRLMLIYIIWSQYRGVSFSRLFVALVYFYLITYDVMIDAQWQQQQTTTIKPISIQRRRHLIKSSHNIIYAPRRTSLLGLHLDNR